jgi:hypothetical protein
MISCDSGSCSYFGKVLVPVPVASPVPVPDPDLFSTVFQQKKFEQNLAFSMPEAALFPRKFASNLRFFYFWITFYVGTGTGMHYSSGSGSSKAKSCGCELAIPAPVPQHR